ncbi:MAG: radical SAM/SPASM domain-containing protein [Marinilabiliales bacterium]|nr:MAG: radical SAM/SPASM domain-containing protein [Marinilabiliales bacterium]
MLSRFRKASFRHFRENEAQINELLYLFWETTLRCNLNCLHCGSDCTKDASVPDMPFDDFLKAILPLHKHYKRDSIIVIITGGEPLVRKDLAENGRRLRENGFRWGIVTNGILYDIEKQNELLNAGMGSVTLSLDGLEDNHNWLRGTSVAFKKALNALELIGSQKRLNADVVTCVNQRNFHELGKISDLVHQNGLAQLLFTISPIGRAKDNPDLFLSNTQMKEMMDFIVTQREKGREVSFSCEGYTGGYEEKVRDGFFFCRAGIHIGSILADGSIGACPNVDPGFSQGNIYKDDFTDVWMNRYQDFRDRSWTKTGICADCKEHKYCNGNGFHLWDAKRDEVLVCHHRKIIGEDR